MGAMSTTALMQNQEAVNTNGGVPQNVWVFRAKPQRLPFSFPIRASQDCAPRKVHLHESRIPEANAAASTE